MRRMTLLSILTFLVLLFLLPFFFTQLMAGSLQKLHLSPQTALNLTLAIIVGGMINIPVARLRHGEATVIDPLAIFGFSGFMQRMSKDTLIAVNVGGCLVPVGIAIYEFVHLAPSQQQNAAFIASGVTTAVCYFAARVIPGIGIAMPGFLPPVTAALCALLLSPEMAAPVAFIAGVMGPLIGADLLHLKDLRASPVGVASIGGAGTFDGIVLSGIIAAYLA